MEEKRIWQVESVTDYRKGKVRVSLDDGTDFVVYKKEAFACQLKEGKQLTEEEWEKIQSEVLLKRAKKRLLYLLQKRDYTKLQLRRKLRSDGHPDAVIDEAIAYVSSLHYVDDLRFACVYIRYHQKQKSRLQLQEALRQKGVSRELIDEAMQQEYTADVSEIIQKYLDRKHYDPDSCDRTQRRKIYASLARRGFSSEDIRRCMKL